MGSVDNDSSMQIMKWLLQKTHLEALFWNRESFDRWTNYKKDHEELIPRLQEMRKDMKVEIMVPMGNKAMMRGNLVHTNEILISLGEGWFIKDSVDHALELCDRRIKKCIEFLEKLEKERNLLESRKDFSIGHNVFPEEDIKEIIEPLDEEKEREWEQSHKESVKSFAKEEAEKRENEVKESDEETWRKLEELALQEELRGELEKAGVEEDDCSEEDDSEEEVDSEEEDESELDSDDLSCPEPDEPDSSSDIQLKKVDDSVPVKELISVRDTSDLAEKPSVSPPQEEPKKMSKFKAARLANKK